MIADLSETFLSRMDHGVHGSRRLGVDVTSASATILSELEPATHDERLSHCSQQLNEKVICPNSRSEEAMESLSFSYFRARAVIRSLPRIVFVFAAWTGIVYEA